jgi:hypothetical protein
MPTLQHWMDERARRRSAPPARAPHRGTAGYFSQPERDYLFEARTKASLVPPFPPHTFVWLAVYDGDATASCHAGVLRGVGELRPHRKEVSIEAHVATISAGRFVTQVLIARLPPEEPQREPILYDSSGRWERTTVRAWPPQCRHSSWPPPVRLDDKSLSLEAFGVRWPLHSTKGEARPV